MSEEQRKVLEFMNEYPMLFNAVLGLDDVMGITAMLPGKHPAEVRKEEQYVKE